MAAAISALKISKATDNGTNDGNKPSNVLDGKKSSRWSSKNKKSLDLDLGKKASVNQIGLSWYKGDKRKADFSISTSVDGKNWSKPSAMTSGGKTKKIEKYKLDKPTEARYVRITGNGNTKNKWNSITEAQVYGSKSTQKPSKSAPQTQKATQNNNNTSESNKGIDLTNWKLSLPADKNKDGRADEVSPNELSKGYGSKDFFYKAKDGGTVFKAPIKGAKTSKNTKNTRTESREMLAPNDKKTKTKGVTKNNWVIDSASKEDKAKAGGVNGRLDATLKVDHVPTTGDKKQHGRVIIGQIHSNNNEPARLYYQKQPKHKKGSVYFAHETQKGKETWHNLIGDRENQAEEPKNGIGLGEKFSYSINMDGKNLNVAIDRPGQNTTSQKVNIAKSGYDKAGQYMYFKAGVYNANNTGKKSDYSQATFYNIKAKH